MTKIQIKTMNIMQEEQAFLIIMNLMICERLSFFQTKNRMNVAFSRAQNDFIVVDDATNIMKKKTKHRRHLKNVIIFIINQNANVKFEKSKTFSYFSIFFDHEYHQNQSIENQINIR
jgi:hypothetical protein